MKFFNTGKRIPNYGALTRVYSFQNNRNGNLGSYYFYNEIYTGSIIGKPRFVDLIIFIVINSTTDQTNANILRSEILNIKGYKIIVEKLNVQSNHLDVFDDITSYNDEAKRKVIIIDKILLDNLENSSDKSLESLNITYFPYDNFNENINKTVMNYIYSVLFTLQEDKFKI